MVLTSFGRARRMTERAAERLSAEVDVLELDVNSPEDLEALTGSLRDRWGALTERCTRSRSRPRTPRWAVHDHSCWRAAAAFQTSAFSLKSLAAALEPLMAAGSSVVGLDFDATRRVADLRLDGRREGCAGVGLPIPGARPRAARDPRKPGLGGAARDGRGSRHPRDSSSSRSCGARRRRSAGTSRIRRRSPTRSASCSRTIARAISGEIVHVDGGFHAVGAPTRASRRAFVGRSRPGDGSLGCVDRWLGNSRLGARIRAARRGRDRVLEHPRQAEPRLAVDGGDLPVRVRAAVARDCWPGSRAAGTGPEPGPIGRSAVAAGVFFAADLILWHHSIDDVGAGLATVLANIQVVLVPLVAWALLSERPEPTRARGAADRVRRRVADLRACWSTAPTAPIRARRASSVLGAGVAYVGVLLLLRRGGSTSDGPAGPLFDVTAIGGAHRGAAAPSIGDARFVPHGRARAG